MSHSRSRKGSVAAEGTSIQERCRLSRGDIRFPDLGRSDDGRLSIPRANRLRRPGCPERHEEGTYAIVREARLAFSRALRPATCPGSPVYVAARRASVRKRIERPTHAGIGWCRRAAERKLHSRAKIDGSKGVPVCRNRLQKSASDAEVQRSATPVGSGARERGPGLRRSREGLVGGEKASTTLLVAAKPRRRGKPEPDVRKGVAGQRFSLDGRHPGAPSGSYRSRGRVGGALGGSREAGNVRTWPVARERRQGCQRFGLHASHREDNVRCDGSRKGTCGPPKRVALTSNQAISLGRERESGRRPENRRDTGARTRT